MYVLTDLHWQCQYGLAFDESLELSLSPEAQGLSDVPNSILHPADVV